MDMLDQTLDSSQDKTNDSVASDEQVSVHLGGGEPTEEQAAAIASVSQGAFNLDPSVQYQVRTDTNSQGQVTYRVVQLAQDGGDGQVVTTSAFPPGTQVAQAVIQTPFGNGNTGQEDPNAETRYTYFPSVAGGGDPAVTQAAAEVGTTAAIGPVAAGGGQFYVMMSPQEVLQGQRNIAPRTTFSPKIEGRTARDDRRRATHNEVERRRRDKINNWIVQLSKLIPDCSPEQTKQGQVGSKGGILAKACDYIQELRSNNAALADRVKEVERLHVDTELLSQQCEELKAENSMLRATLSQNGIVKLQDMHGNPS